MEIETIEIESHGDKIIIPEGCKVIINGNEIIIEKDENEFKDGDVLACKDSLNITCPFIYKNTDEAGFHLFYIGLNCDGFIEEADSINSRWGDNPLRLATEEEKQLLFDEMKEQGLWWNAEEKRVEKIRWRAGKKGNYFVLYGTAFEVDCYTEIFDEIDADLYNIGNYFRTEEQAEEAAKRVKETLRKFHEEIGE